MAAKRSLSLRKRAFLALPWVGLARKPGRCEAMLAHAPLKAYWKRDHTRQDDPELLDKWRCTQTGYYRYTFLRSNMFRQGATVHYCWQHMMYRALDMEEDARVNRWLKRHGWLDDEGRLIDAHSSRESR